MVGDGRRPQRVAEAIRMTLSEVLARELGDPELSALVITRVEMGADLGAAHVYVRLLLGDEQERTRRRAIQALGRATPRLKRALSPRLAMKRLPDLRFAYDTAPDKRARVDALLSEIEKEREGEPGDQDPQT